MYRVIVSIAVAAALSACTWVPIAPEAKNVRVLPAGSTAAASCERLGEITVSVQGSVAFYERNAVKVRDELETLARNEAADMNASAIQQVDEPADGKQRFMAYRCGG